MTVEGLAHPEWWTPALLLLLGAAAAIAGARLLARSRRRRLGSAAPAGLPLASGGQHTQPTPQNIPDYFGKFEFNVDEIIASLPAAASVV